MPAVDIHFAEHTLGPVVQLGSNEMCWVVWSELTLAMSHDNTPESCSKLLWGTGHHLPLPHTSGQGPCPLAGIRASITNPAQVSLASSLAVSSITLAQKTGDSKVHCIYIFFTSQFWNCWSVNRSFAWRFHLECKTVAWLEHSRATQLPNGSCFPVSKRRWVPSVTVLCA